MKLKLFTAFGAIALSALLGATVFAQSAEESISYEENFDYTDEMDDLDDLFADVSDKENAVESTEQKKNTSNDFNDKITFWGNFNAKAAWIQQFTPTLDHYPAASFSSYLGVTVRPYKDLSLQACFLTSFPSMNFSVYTYFLDYELFGKAFITIGKTRKKWGNSTIFDTNILDDKATDPYPNASLLLAPATATPSSFDLIATIPIGKGEFQAIGSYDSTSSILKSDFFEGELSIEYPVGLVSIGAFTKFWNKVGSTHKDPAFGLQLTGDVLGLHFNLWGSLNVGGGKKIDMDDNITWEPASISYARVVAGISKAWLGTPKMGFTAEYEFIYKQNPTGEDDFIHNLGFIYMWSHVAGSAFSPSLQFMCDTINWTGAVVPSVSINVLPHATIAISSPVLFGDQKITYSGASISSTKEKPTVLVVAMLSLSGVF